MSDNGEKRRGSFGRTWLAVLVAILLLAAAGTSLVAAPFDDWVGGWGSNVGDSDSIAVEVQTVVVSVVDLTEKSEVDATLTATETMNVRSIAAGTITTLPAVGQTLAVGDVVYSIDEQPVVYLPGSIPAWRTMAVDSVGPDVEQLEEALVLLGYDTAGALSVDETYSSYTATLVELWQEELGLDPTGTVAHGAVIFAQPHTDNGITVASVGGAVGDQTSTSTATSTTASTGASTGASAPILVLSDGRQHVEFVVDHADQLTLTEGSEVEVRLPDRSIVSATVTERRNEGNGQWVVTAVPDVGDAELPASLNDVPVTVSWLTTLSQAALAVPADALLRHDNGSYRVTVLDDDVERQVVVVPIATADRLVEVTGEVDEGDLVVVP